MASKRARPMNIVSPTIVPMHCGGCYSIPILATIRLSLAKSITLVVITSRFGALWILTNVVIDDDFELLKHPRVYAAADFLGIERLKELCVLKFEEQLEQHWTSDTFTDAVREVYGTTYPSDRAMKDPLVKTAKENGEALLARQCFVKLTKEVSEFSADMLASIFST
jgi:hypothetical protein